MPFWRWVCSWARAMRRPSDLGFDDDGVRPAAARRARAHRRRRARRADGHAVRRCRRIGLQEEREERRRTIDGAVRAGRRARRPMPSRRVVWCHLNDEGDLLDAADPRTPCRSAAPTRDDAKEETLLAFARGEIRVLVTKPKIGAWGLNWQHCAHVTFFPSHRYEQYYQGVRRCWRFGQTRPVRVDIVDDRGRARRAREPAAQGRRRPTGCSRRWSRT